MIDKTKRPYRSRYFNDERKWKSHHIDDDVFQVGTHKAIGYILKDKDYNPDRDLNTLRNKFLKQNRFSTIIKPSDYLSRRIGMEILWVGDKVMIQNILDQQKDVLIKSKWPTDAKKFFDKICVTDVGHDENQELCHLIADLFNSWCLHCQGFSGVEKSEDGRSGVPLSDNPYDPELDNNG